MAIDPASPVVQLCISGMQAEARGRLDDARESFAEAWSRCTSDLEACIAAHYLARHQEDPQEALRWNEEALRRADAAGAA